MTLDMWLISQSRSITDESEQLNKAKEPILNFLLPREVQALENSVIATEKM